jgi:hypothetical protein
LNDLLDGNILSQILSKVDSNWFKYRPIMNESDYWTQNWIVKFNNLSRLLKLIISYFEESIGQTLSELPNLTAIARDSDTDELLLFLQLIVAVAVQSTNKERFIKDIQELPPNVQEDIMMAIQATMSKMTEKTEQEYSN